MRVTLVNQKFHSPLGSAIKRLTEANLQIDKFAFTSGMTKSQSSISHLASNEGKRLSDNLTILINDICFAMEKWSMPVTVERCIREIEGPRLHLLFHTSARPGRSSTPWPLINFSNLGLFAK